MKKITDILFSLRTTIVLLSIFAVAIGYATFVENSDGTPAAKALVYNANWFVVLLLLGAANLAGVIVKTKLVQRKKWSVLIFHSAFIFILIGAAITRYFGYEGIMHIRQGETSNSILTEQTAITIDAEYNGKNVTQTVPVLFSENRDNTFSQTLEVGGRQLTVENELFVPNAQETIESSQTGEPAAAIFIMSGASQSMDITLFGKEKAIAGNLSFGFGDGADSADIHFSVVNDKLFFKSAKVVTKTGTLASGMIDRDNAVTITPGSLSPGEENTVYRSEGVVFMIKGFLPRASKMLTQLTPDDKKGGMDASVNQGTDGLVMRISDGKSETRVNVLKDESDMAMPTVATLNGVKVFLTYGKMKREIPFSITLRKFELERYQGSMSPSSYASEITVRDSERKSEKPYRIFMNNILNYRGYRFFQSSYDQDEQGTILSVNHDYWGTMVTYIGYLLLLIGMTLTLFDKKSRFRTLARLTSQMQDKRKSVVMLLFVLISSTQLFAASSKQDHLNAFKQLLIQDASQGRIEPISTFSSDILRKIYKHNSYKNLTPEEVFLGLIADPDKWKNEPLIKVYHNQLAKELGAVDGYISYNNMFDPQNGTYKLSGLVDKAYIKDQSKRNTYEKEIVNVDERFNILSQIFDGSMFPVFPIKDAADGKWASAKSIPLTPASAKGCPYAGGAMGGLAMGQQQSGLTGEMPPMDDETDNDTAATDNPHQAMGGMSVPDPSMGPCTRSTAMGGNHTAGSMTGNVSDTNSPDHLLSVYLDALAKAFKTSNWSDAGKALEKIKSYQTEQGGAIVPSPTLIKLEVAYNEWNLFGNLSIIYFLVGFILLVLHLTNIFKYSARLDKLLSYSVYALALLFAFYTGGLALRWIISGHAPWSNGYESMVFAGWASSLAGLLFARKSPLAFSITALLSAIALMVAGMSWMNPEITNLVPVLKSYWLVVHVAVITSSYGFFAMGTLLGLLNLVLIISRNFKRKLSLDDTIQEISYIIEMGLIVGLFMLTIGNFLGGVWANESWGRYWGWDAKETWALVSILVYAVILHARLIPKGNTPLILSTLSVVGFSSIIMTFLGVNYYLSGMHSYGKGTPPPLPDALFVVIVVVVAIIALAFVSEQKKRDSAVKTDSKV